MSYDMGIPVGIWQSIYFGNTPGMNAAAATVLAFMREPVLRLVTLRDSVEDFEPGIKSMGFSPFFRYILLCTFLFCTILLVIDTFFILQPACLIVENIDRCLNNRHLYYCVLRQSGGKK